MHQGHCFQLTLVLHKHTITTIVIFYHTVLIFMSEMSLTWGRGHLYSKMDMVLVFGPSKYWPCIGIWSGLNHAYTIIFNYFWSFLWVFSNYFGKFTLLLKHISTSCNEKHTSFPYFCCFQHHSTDIMYIPNSKQHHFYLLFVFLIHVQASYLWQISAPRPYSLVIQQPIGNPDIDDTSNV